MKKNLLLFVCLCLIGFTVSAQDTLKVNFKPAGSSSQDGWDSILVSDKVLYEADYTEFEVFNSTVKVKPVWLSSPEATNIRAVNRTDSRYVGPLANVIRSYIAVDSRYSNDCDVIGIEITGLPAGTYAFKSFHHDYRDQYGSFNVETSVNNSVADANNDEMMISHSMSYEEFSTTYPSEMIPDAQTEDYKNHRVVSSLDSVTQYSFNNIESSGASDVVSVNFKNILSPSADMDHHVKFILINGFMLFESATGIDKKLTQKNLQIINRSNCHVLFTGQNMSSLKIYSVDGILIRQINVAGREVELTDLNKGIYIAEIGFSQGKSICKKFTVR